jgi:tetratricopeptide (TPR) repeat protein
MKRLVTIATLVALASTSLAGNKDKADALFKEGKKLMSEKRYAEACPKLEQSMKLDPGIGTELNIGKCYEDWGRIGKALIAYKKALEMAKGDKDKRVPQIQELVDGLDSQAPRLTIKLPSGASADGVKVTLDGEVITTFGTALIVDPGPKTIEYTVDDGPKKSKTVPVDRGGDSEVTLDIPKDRVAKKPNGGGKQSNGGGDKPDGKPADVATPPAPGRNMRLGGIVLGGAGVLAIGVSSIMTLSARGQYNDALEMHCMGMKNMCDPEGLQTTADARSTANTATVIFIAGVAMVGGGVALYLLAPKGAAKMESQDETARYIVPSVTKDGAGVVFGGRF